MPDLDAAAPLIDAIFGTAPKERALPYALCGGARSRINAPARCLLQLLALASSRCTATALFALLQQASVARRFGLDEEALAQVHAWLLECRLPLGTGRAAPRQLRAAGHAAPHAGRCAAAPVPRLCAARTRMTKPSTACSAPATAEGSRALALGALWRFALALQRAHADLQQPKLPEAWAGDAGWPARRLPGASRRRDAGRPARAAPDAAPTGR